jgi:DNA-binding SARP family transcriptional activator
MAMLNVRLFGKPSILRNGRPVAGLEAPKMQEIFIYLLIRRDHPQPREALASLLWSDCSTAQSRKGLRQVLWRLHLAIDGRDDTTEARLLDVRSDSVRLDAHAPIWLDVDEFERAFEAARGIAGDRLDAPQAARLGQAAQLYQGDLLEGWYQDWCLFERERLQNLYLALLDKLMVYCEAHGAYEEGVGYGADVLRRDRACERTHRRLMRLHYLAGDRTAALHQYRRCAQALEEELGVRPAKLTAALYEQIRADQVDPIPSRADRPPEPALPATPLTDALDRLAQFQAVLADVQRQVQKDIQAIELGLRGP